MTINVYLVEIELNLVSLRIKLYFLYLLGEPLGNSHQKQIPRPLQQRLKTL